MRLVLILLSLAVIVNSSNMNSHKVSYNDYKVFRMQINTEEEKQTVQNIVESRNGFTYWSGLSTVTSTSVMVAPKDVESFTSQMNASGIDYEKFIENVQDLMDSQVACNDRNNFTWKCYQTLEKIYDWLDHLTQKYPKTVEIIVGGHTYEGRRIKGVKISFKRNNPGIFVESGIHSYEWIAPATATYLINELLTSNDTSVRELAESYDWYIFPSVNPDGYVYSHTMDRMWTKTRSKQGSGCRGVNLNRNWNYMWKGDSNPCDPKYAGNEPSSEIEVKTLSNYLKSISDKIFAYISFHSFQQLLMFPYDYTYEYLDNHNESMAIGLKAINALSQRYGTKYGVDNGAKAIYPATGTSTDWVKGTLKLPIVYTYELRDKGNFGMMLPPEQIIPNGQEILDSLIATFRAARKFGYP